MSRFGEKCTEKIFKIKPSWNFQNHRTCHVIIRTILQENFRLWTVGVDSSGTSLQKWSYATLSSEHTVFFSKRRKNSSLCAHYMAAWNVSAASASWYSRERSVRAYTSSLWVLNGTVFLRGLLWGVLVSLALFSVQTCWRYKFLYELQL